jgi:hypothetical protein
MGKIVIATYKPKAGKEKILDRLVRDHVKVLRNQGLATMRPPMIMKSADGTVVEVFEWISKQAIEDAQKNKDVQEYWAKYKEVCDIIPVSNLIEANTSFSEFNPF